MTILKFPEQATYWNGAPCAARRVIVRVGRAIRPTWWCALLHGTERRAVQVTIGRETFYLDNEDESGWWKVTEGEGSPTIGHRSLPSYSVAIRDDTEAPRLADWSLERLRNHTCFEFRERVVRESDHNIMYESCRLCGKLRHEQDGRRVMKWERTIVDGQPKWVYAYSDPRNSPESDVEVWKMPNVRALSDPFLVVPDGYDA